jgi:pyruvate ferredoxin oxidoreductase alpha subunit
MRRPLEGSHAIAKAVALCRPEVIAAYPITPQTHIVERLSEIVADGALRCELVSVESELSAASVVLGAAAAGSRAYTASSSQGILLMAEALYNIAGLRLPLVLTCANRAVSAPINIWNDHQDAMAVRDAGWIQLFCADNQEAVDTTIQAFRIAEETELPVMVNVDGFVLTHTLEVLDVPAQEAVDRYLPPFHFARALDPANPLTLGTLVGPEAFTEIRHAHHLALLRAKEAIRRADDEYETIFGRRACSSGLHPPNGLLSVEGDADADLAIVTMGSTSRTLRAAMREHPSARKAKLVTLRAFRPFPDEELTAACDGLRDLVVLERALSPGSGGILASEVRAALASLAMPPRVHAFAVGLGGRDVPIETYARVLEAIRVEDRSPFRILDLDPARCAEEDL